MYRFNPAMYMARVEKKITAITRIYRVASIILVAALAGLLVLSRTGVWNARTLPMVLMIAAAANVISWGFSMVNDYFQIKRMQHTRISVESDGIHYAITGSGPQYLEAVIHSGYNMQILRDRFVLYGDVSIRKNGEEEMQTVRKARFDIPRMFADEPSLIKEMRRHLAGMDENTSFALTEDIDGVFEQLREVGEARLHSRFLFETDDDRRLQDSIDRLLSCYLIPGSREKDGIQENVHLDSLRNAIAEVTAGLKRTVEAWEDK